MKKILMFLLALVITVSMTACSTTDKSDGGQTAAPTTTQQQETTRATEASVAQSETTAAQSDAEATTEETTEAVAEETSSVQAPAKDDMSSFCVPGYELGEIPAIPLIEVPTIPDYSDEQKQLLDAIEAAFAEIPGVSVKPASCDGDGLVYVSDFIVANDDVTVSDNDDISSVIDSAGSGVLNSDSLTAVVNQDGSGVLEKDGVSVVVMPDGSGVIEDENKDVMLTRNFDGSGSYSKGEVSITVIDERQGTYSNDAYTLVYLDEKNAQYTDDKMSIIITDGNALIVNEENATTVPAKPLAKVPLIGPLPTLDKLERPNVCGLRVVFDDSILFDFDKYDLRPEGELAIQKIVSAIDELDISALEIHGHTDSKSDHAYNLTLSENRANAVGQYMEKLGVKADLKTIGFGEDKPIAPNQNADGSDNPSGRQANRRVEIFIPSN